MVKLMIHLTVSVVELCEDWDVGSHIFCSQEEGTLPYSVKTQDPYFLNLLLIRYM